MKQYTTKAIPALISMVALSASMTAISCSNEPTFVNLPFETRLLFLNFSQEQYTALRLRTHVPDGQNANGASPANGSSTAEGSSTEYATTRLLPPGSLLRADFLDFLDTGCPESLDLQILVYNRVNDDLPIGLDDGATVENTPIVAGEILNVPLCSIQPQQGFTVVNWDAPDGTARVKLAQGTDIDVQFSQTTFPAPDFAWEVTGVDATLAEISPPEVVDFEEIGGTVTLADGTGVEGVGVLIRTQYRVRLSDNNAENDPDVGFSDPIDFTTTDADGRYAFNRPPGAYLVEFFSDDLLFRPEAVNVETPLEIVSVIAEPILP